MTASREPGAAPSVAATLGGPRRVPRAPWWSVPVVALFGLLFLYDAVEGYGNLAGLSVYAGELGTGLTATGWIVLVAGMVLPLLCFAAALVVARRMRPLARVGVLFVALCVSAVLALDIQLVFGAGSLIDLG